MSADDVVLSLQRSIDRLVRRVRRGRAPATARRRFLVVQIDGLSRAVLEQALAAGYVPFMKKLLRRDGHRLEPMTVGVPTSTPAFQIAAMYGVRPDIPGFHYYNRERKSDIHFPRAGHAAWVESKHAAGRRGILDGGSAYGCVFTGGADNNFFTFSSLTQPSGRGMLAALSPFVVLVWVFMKALVRTVVELAKTAPGIGTRPAKGQPSRRWFRIKIGISVWVREFFTLSVARDLYAGTPAIYVNYVDYDEAAHAFGPRSKPALVTLRRVDRAIRQLARVLRRVPEHRYDLYILADHGQAPSTPYRDLSGGERFERRVFEELLGPKRTTTPNTQPRVGLAHGIHARRQGTTGLFQQFLNYMEEDYVRDSDPEAHEQDGIRVISAGPNALLYVLDAAQALDAGALERRFPGFAERLSRSPGVGFVLARSSAGPICYWHGKPYALRASEPGPFRGRGDVALVVHDIAHLMSMPSAGDFVIYGTGAAEGTVSFIPERGAHAGPSHDEMHTFIVHPAEVSLPLPITHPMQLYDHFMRYHERAAAPPPIAVPASAVTRFRARPED